MTDDETTTNKNYNGDNNNNRKQKHDEQHKQNDENDHNSEEDTGKEEQDEEEPQFRTIQDYINNASFDRFGCDQLNCSGTGRHASNCPVMIRIHYYSNASHR